MTVMYEFVHSAAVPMALFNNSRGEAAFEILAMNTGLN